MKCESRARFAAIFEGTGRVWVACACLSEFVTDGGARFVFQFHASFIISRTTSLPLNLNGESIHI